VFAQHQPYALSDFPDWLTPEAADALAFIMHTRAAEQGEHWLLRQSFIRYWICRHCCCGIVRFTG
jgi:hypothetical protein